MNYKIKDLPLDERPREKLKLKGKESLSNEELVAIILKTGNKDESVKELAIRLVKNLNNIQDLNDITINDLMKIKGIKEAKAITLIAAIELGKRVYFYQDNKKKKITSATEIYEFFKPLIIGLKQEKLFAVFLNTKNEIITYETIFIGTQNKSITHPREIFNRAIKNSAVKIILVHNHPTNDPTPSNEDIKFTDEMSKIGNLLKIPIIDHIVIGSNNYFSFFDNHML
jgi:DNA repair protein RadC